MTATSKIPTKKLWNPISFIIFSVIFSFLPAGITCALNYGRYGNAKKKWIVLLSTILGFIALIILVSKLSVNTWIIFLAVDIIVGIFLWNIQRKLYKEHIQNSGQRASYLLPIIIGLVVFSMSAASIFYSINVPKNVIDYGNNHLFYTSNIPKSQAQRLGNYLQSGSFFTDSSAIDVKIDKQKDIYILSIIVENSYLDNEEFIEPLKGFAKEFSQNVFDNNKVRIDLCNDRFKVLKSISAD